LFEADVRARVEIGQPHQSFRFAHARFRDADVKKISIGQRDVQHVVAVDVHALLVGELLADHFRQLRFDEVEEVLRDANARGFILNDGVRSTRIVDRIFVSVVLATAAAAAAAVASAARDRDQHRDETELQGQRAHRPAW
jgi:hypothetical protein